MSVYSVQMPKLDRREFLEGSAAATAVSLLGYAAVSPTAAAPEIASIGWAEIIDFQTLANRDYPANYWSGRGIYSQIVTIKGTVPNKQAWNKANDETLVFWTDSIRDGQISGLWSNWFSIIIRCGGDEPGSEKAIIFQHHTLRGGGYVSLAIMDTVNHTLASMVSGGDGKGQFIYERPNGLAFAAEGIAAEYSTTYREGDNFTLGANGFEVYLRYNGRDLFRTKEVRCTMQSGIFGVALHAGYGFRGKLVLNRFPEKRLFSRTR